MNRTAYFDLCAQKLAALSSKIEILGKLNILHDHNHAEDFYLNFLNKLYGYKLENLNAVKQNIEGIDLCDKTNQIVLQVSSTATKAKVESALSKDLSSFVGYSFQFVSIAKDASPLRLHTYINPHKLTFDPPVDIHDIPSLLTKIRSLEIGSQQAIYTFLQDELDPGGKQNFAETNLAEVINILSREDMCDGYAAQVPIVFEVEKKLAFNNLNSAAMIVEEYKIHHHRVTRLYEEFNSAGKNKSDSVLKALLMMYAKLSVNFSGDELFFQIVESAIEKIRSSANYAAIPLDELEQYVSVLAVDAFIRCKIFKNPSELTHVVA